MLVSEWLIRGHEAAERGGVEAGAEVVEAGFGVAVFAGEVEWAKVAAAAVAREGIAEGKASERGIVPRIVDVLVGCAEAFGAEPV